MKLLILAIFSVALLLTGCQKPSRLGNSIYLPDNWLTVKTTAWQFRELPKQNRTELLDLRSKLIKEQNGRYYSFYGHYPPETSSEIDATTSRLNQAFSDLQYSSTAIFASLTPNLKGLSSTYSQQEAGIAVTNNANLRMLDDDAGRLFLLDKPSLMSPLPTIHD